MSKNRYIDTKFWDDNYIIKLDPIEKLLFIYCLTNPLTNIAGVYEISERRISFDTGIDKDMVLNIIKRFSKDKKINYVKGWIIIANFPKHQNYQDSPKIKRGIELILEQIPDSIRKSIDTLSIPYTYSLNYSNPNPNPNSNPNPNPNSNIKDTPQNFSDSFFKKGKCFTELLDSFSKSLNIARENLEQEFEHFLLYWTEPNKSGNKVRWELERTFDVKRRLYTWLKNKQVWARENKKGVSII